ncbi:uncharacterized protein LOC112089792 [Eutrema salsugineum]|uniref:uncharacterized protein LOC112089792 n=1 Tax=Eutrema salsugineum TaxID=72664 RepID=UPI000CED4699|nr:uncharacterized protein LOC112089792 [Eutrema salsugineum]
MSGLVWNVRGLNKSTKHSIVRRWIQNQGFQFGALLETRVREGKAGRVAASVCRDWSVITNFEFNRLGRIWVMWSPRTRLTLFFKSGQMITVTVKLEDKDDRPWICLGDYNEILEGEEHSQYKNSPNITSGMRDFQNLVLDCHLEEMAYHGPLFTWCNRRDTSLISKKLDRVLKNTRWDLSFPHSYNVFEAGGCSDHLQCRLHLEAGRAEGNNPFKFVNTVAELDDFLPMVQSFWENTQPIFSSTSSMFCFTKKLKALKPLIRSLAKNRMGNLSRKTKEVYETLCEKQNANASHLKGWRRRRKLTGVGISFRSLRKTSLNSDPRFTGSRLGMAEGFFSEFLQHIPTDYEGILTADLQNLIQYRCSEEEGNNLIKIVTDEDVRSVLFSMPSNKSLGPDGYNMEFYKATWSIVGKEFTIAVKSFF